MRIGILVFLTMMLAFLDNYGQPTFQELIKDGMAHGAVPTNDSCFVISGEKYTSGPGIDGFMAKFDLSGDTLWTRTYGNMDSDVLIDVRQTFDGGYIATGSIGGLTTSDAWVIRTDALGDM